MVGGDQPVVERHQDRADQAGAVEALEEEVRVGAEDADAIALADAEAAQRVGEADGARLQLARR